MTEKTYCVYKHTSPTGKVYIGVTSQTPERRWENGHGYTYNTHFWNAIVKYGWDNFLHEIVCEGLSSEQAFSLEQELIAAYKATDPRFGYNLTDGGFGGARGVRNSEETKRRKSESAKLAWSRPRRGNLQKRSRVCGQRYQVKQGHKKMAVEQWTKDGVYVQTWVSMCEIERVLGIPTGKISECCRGKRPSYRGYIWKLSEVVVGD